jgi:dipeptidase E
MDDCKEAPDLNEYSALSMVRFYPLPHYTNAPSEKAVEKIIEKYSSELNLMPFSNSQVIMVNGNTTRVETV